MLRSRLATGFFLAGAILAILWVDEWFSPWYPLWAVASILAIVMAAREMAGLLAASIGHVSLTIVIAGSLVVGLANWWPHVIALAIGVPMGQPNALLFDPMAPVNALAWPLWAFVSVVMASFLCLSLQFEKPGTTMATLAASILAIAYVGLLGSFIIQHRWLEGSHHGVIPLMILVATAKGADIGAYTTGRAFGRHKLWPVISPNKTIEGAVGGLIFAVFATAIVVGFARYAMHTYTLSWRATLGYGFVVGTAAQLGDLMESMIKRDGDAKDADSTIPGFGGLLDVLDSLLFAGPVSYAYWLLFAI